MRSRTPRWTPNSAAAALVAAVIAMAVAACGPNNNSSSTDSVPVTSASSPPASTSATGGTHTGNTIDVCAAVPLSAVVAATGRGYTDTTAETKELSGIPADQCDYSHGDINQDADAIMFTIAVVHGADPRGVFALEDIVGDMQPVAGLGDSAQADDVELDVAWGSDVVLVVDVLYPGDISPLTSDVFVTLAEQVHQSL